MATRPNERQRQESIAADIRAGIMNGDLAPEHRLPNNSELSVQFGVAGTTIQAALKILKDEGFLVGRKGQGVFVRSRQPFVVDVANYFQPSAGKYSYELLKVAEVPAPAQIARALEVPDGGKVVLRQRLLMHGGAPVELSNSYYPADLVRGTPLAGARKIRGGAPAALAELGFPQRSLTDEVSTRPPTTEELEILQLPSSVPVLQQFRTIFADEQRPVEASVLVKGGHLYVLRYSQQIH